MEICMQKNVFFFTTNLKKTKKTYLIKKNIQKFAPIYF